MKQAKLRFFPAIAAAALALAVSGAALGQGYPSKPIKLIVPFTPGSGTDIVARAFSDKLSAGLGQPVIVENRPGAGGTVGAAVVAKADADGYTLMVQSSSHTVNPATYSTLPYDTVKEFSGITTLVTLPNVLIIAPSKGIKSVKELVAAGKAKPGTINYASAGAGSATHLNAEKFRVGAGLDAVHIPFKGSPEAITEVMTGRVDYYFSPVVSALPQIKDGRLLALAVGSPKRSSVLPDVPTTIEAGVPNSDYNFWIGLLAPGRTPRDIINRLYQETLKALATPEVKERLAKLGAEQSTMTPEAFDAYIKDEMAANAILVKAAGIKAN
jgi:tripartite-type tricarboxylate transporter receptor subunit TctC